MSRMDMELECRQMAGYTDALVKPDFIRSEKDKRVIGTLWAAVHPLVVDAVNICLKPQPVV